jgi:hypothetical protein
VTVKEVLAETAPSVALMVEVPFPLGVARPTALIVAAFVAEDDQLTADVRSNCVPSE